MPIPIIMPALSPTMADGNLAKWLKAEGEAITIGDVIAEIETDKATMEIEAVDEGVLGKILVPEGSESVAVNAVIGLILQEGEDETAVEGFAAGQPASAPAPMASPASKAASASATAPAPAAPASTAPAPAAPAPQRMDGGRIKASPLARRMARQAGLDLAALSGSGPHGRIVKADIDAALAGKAPAAPAPPPAAEIAPAEAPREIPHTNMRKTIARRLVEAKQAIPHIYLAIDCEVDELLALQKNLNQRAEERGEDYKLTVNDFVVRAVAFALRKVPRVNSSWNDTAILEHATVDVAVAVALDDGLITPIVRNADRKGLATISREIKELAARARQGKLMPEEYQGGTFAVSNLGMFGVKEFSAVVNPPHVAILAVGAAAQRPVVRGGALAVATVMSCTLSTDHRVVDGAVAAQFLQAFKGYMDDPLSVLL